MAGVWGDGPMPMNVMPGFVQNRMREQQDQTDQELRHQVRHQMVPQHVSGAQGELLPHRVAIVASGLVATLVARSFTICRFLSRLSRVL